MVGFLCEGDDDEDDENNDDADDDDDDGALPLRIVGSCMRQHSKTPHYLTGICGFREIVCQVRHCLPGQRGCLPGETMSDRAERLSAG